MTIYWVDPYIESPSGGVDGTTGAGTLGSYSNPYSLNTLPVESGYVAGDEIRLKALPSNFWIPGPTLVSSISGSYALQFSDSTDITEGDYYKYITVSGATRYMSWNDGNKTYCHNYASPWQGVAAKAAPSNTVQKLDPQYHLSNLANPTQDYYLRGQASIEMTLTAGWVSESSRGGETIINLPTNDTSTIYLFGHSTVQNNKMTVDAPELSFIRSKNKNSCHLNVYGKYVTMKSLFNAAVGNSSSQLRLYTAYDLVLETASTASYMYIYTPYYDVTNGIARSIDYVYSGYYFRLYSQGDAKTTNPVFKFKELTCYGFGRSASFELNYYNGTRLMIEQTIDGSSTLTEMEYDPNINLVDTVTDDWYTAPKSSLGTKYAYNENHNYRNYFQSSIKTFGGYVLKGATLDPRYGDVHFRNLVLDTGVTLETLTSSSVKAYSSWNDNHYPGKAWGSETTSGRLVALVPNYNARTMQEAMMMYNSTEYENRLVYHLMPRNGDTTAAYHMDRVDIDMPDGVTVLDATKSYKLEVILGGTTQGSVGFYRARLEGNDNNDTWLLSSVTIPSVDVTSGGAGAIVSSDPFDSTKLGGMTQITLILTLFNGATSGVSKLCIDHIKLVEF